jgi:hypothetical protein
MPMEQNLQVIQRTYEITTNEETQANYHQDNGDNITQHQRNTQIFLAERGQAIDLGARVTTTNNDKSQKDNDTITSIKEISDQINNNNNEEQSGIMPQYTNTVQNQETTIIDTQSQQGTNYQEPTTQRPQLIQQIMNQYDTNLWEVASIICLQQFSRYISKKLMGCNIKQPIRGGNHI